MDRSDDVEFGDVLTSLALALLHGDSATDDLQHLAELSCRLIGPCSGASVSMLVEGQTTTVATTDRVALHLDLVQYEHDEGPCVAALGGEVVRIGLLAADQRFPHFARGAADQRVQSVLSTPAIDHGAVVGSLNLYSHEAEAFDDSARDIALVMAAEIAHALVRSDVLGFARGARDELQARYDETAIVSRAQGVLVALQECSLGQAGDLISNAADQNREPLIDTAQRILDSVRTHTAADPAPDDG